QAAAPLIRPGMVVAPVPLHLFRLMRRRYNQAALLSAPLDRAWRLPHMQDPLIRNRHTPAQGFGDRASRFAKQDGERSVNARRLAAIAGRAVLPMDVVMASGAPLAHAAQVRLEPGVGPVCVGMLARSVKDDLIGKDSIRLPD